MRRASSMSPRQGIDAAPVARRQLRLAALVGFPESTAQPRPSMRPARRQMQVDATAQNITCTPWELWLVRARGDDATRTQLLVADCTRDIHGERPSSASSLPGT